MTLTQINKAGLDELALDHVFTIGASGTDHYTFQGEGLNGTVNDPTLYLTRGKTYRFENGTGAHPIRIQSTSGASGTAYNTGVTNNAGSGTVIVEVQHDAPDVLYYQCTSHANMNGILYITGALADGGVTTDKLATDAVTTAKVADAQITSALMATNSVNTGAIVDGSVTTAKLADDAVTDAKLANSINSAIAANTAKNTNVSTNLSTSTTTTAVTIASSDGTNATIGEATGSAAGVMSVAHHDKLDGIAAGATNSTSTTINNNADNRFITGSGSANTLEGESNFQFVNNRLLYGGATSSMETSLVIKGNSNSFVTNPGRIFLQAGQDMGGGASMGIIDFGCTGDKNGGMIIGRAAQDYTGSNYSTNLEFWTANPSSTTRTKKVEISSGGNMSVIDGDLSFASGHGIDFSATSDAAGGTSELFDDYEEGTWTPSLTNVFAVGTNRVCLYRKIGQMVFITFDVFASGNNMDICTSGETVISGLPFTTPSSFNAPFNVAIYMNNATGQQMNNYINTQPQIVIHGTSRINNVRHLWGFGCYPAT